MKRWPFILISLLMIGAVAAGEHIGVPRCAQRPNILLIVLDTVRYDATTFGDPALNNTPFLASLASHSVVFTKAYSTHDFTPPSHFSMMTGLRDGLGSDDDRVENGVAWQLARAGYSTFAASANGLLAVDQMPTMRGFSDFRQVTNEEGESVLDKMNDILKIDARLAMFGFRPTVPLRRALYDSADRLLPIVEQQIRSAKPPFFSFVNLLDAHEPYVPDPSIYPPERKLPPHFFADVLKRPVLPEFENPNLITDPARRRAIKVKLEQVRFPHLLADDLTPQALRTYHQRYAAKVRGLDQTLRRFFDELRREGLLDNTIVIITSDHGEAFGEAGFITHMLGDHGDREANYHVPLLIVLPPRLHRRAAVVDRVVSIDMLAPTIYDLAGVDWSPFATRHSNYAPSLVSFVTKPAQQSARVQLPKPEPQDQRRAIDEREKALRSLGYIH
jgi:arylsulfatase A-like enzyme